MEGHTWVNSSKTVCNFRGRMDGGVAFPQVLLVSDRAIGLRVLLIDPPVNGYSVDLA